MERKEIGICVECGSPLYKEDEMLPDYPNLYQCSLCLHPSNEIFVEES